MSIRDYRRQLEQQVAQESALAGAEGGPELLGAPAGGEEDADQARSLAAQPEAPPELRATALGRLVRAEDPRTAHVAPLARLADPNETPSVRLAALALLKQLAISSPTFPEWRSLFFEALRRALSEPELRAAALEVLTHGRDRYTQEKLLEGLRKPDQALVPPDQALQLLSSDPHADVRDVAREIASAPPDEATLLQAMKVLAGDPGSVEGFKSLLADSSQSISVRKLAATALNNLAPELLQSVGDQRLEAVADDEPALAAADDQPALAKHIGALLRARREPVLR
jgi:hypothetical protein